MRIFYFVRKSNHPVWQSGFVYGSLELQQNGEFTCWITDANGSTVDKSSTWTIDPIAYLIKQGKWLFISKDQAEVLLKQIQENLHMQNKQMMHGATYGYINKDAYSNQIDAYLYKMKDPLLKQICQKALSGDKPIQFTEKELQTFQEKYKTLYSTESEDFPGQYKKKGGI